MDFDILLPVAIRLCKVELFVLIAALGKRLTDVAQRSAFDGEGQLRRCGARHLIS